MAKRTATSLCLNTACAVLATPLRSDLGKCVRENLLYLTSAGGWKYLGAMVCKSFHYKFMPILSNSDFLSA